MTDDARDAKKYRLLLRWLRDGRIPGPAHGRPFKLIETCPQFGDERKVPNIDCDLEHAIGMALPTGGQR